jgi:hypothetical protein
MLQSVSDGIVNPTFLFMSHEAWFHVSGFVNAQNACHWGTENPHTIHEVPIHDQKVGVWCMVSGWRIIGPVFFYNTVNWEHYVNSIFEPFLQMLTEEEKQHAYFRRITQQPTHHSILWRPS